MPLAFVGFLRATPERCDGTMDATALLQQVPIFAELGEAALRQVADRCWNQTGWRTLARLRSP
jgi:hypothetical protein